MLYSFLTNALDEVGGQGQAPAVLPKGKSPITHGTIGLFGPRAHLDGWRKEKKSMAPLEVQTQCTNASCLKKFICATEEKLSRVEAQ